MMQKLLLFITLLLPALGSAEPLRVFVSVPPLKGFAEKVGGEHVAVRTMVRPGYSPDLYDPTPRQIGALAKAALYIRIGVPFEKAWMKRIRSANPGMQVLDARTGIDLRTIETHEHEQGYEADRSVDDRDDALPGGLERDPHIWTSPPLVSQMARNIRDALTELDPAHGPDYARNYASFAAELEELDRYIRVQLKDLPNWKFMVFHPAWGYFAETYGLTQVPIEKEGKEPGARALAALIDQARRERVQVIFVQPQFSKRSANRVARAIGGRVVAVDPLASNYVENLRGVAQQIAGEARQ